MHDAITFHDKGAARFDEGYDRSRAFQERYGVWKRYINRHVQPGMSVLDAGCGSGIFSFAAAARGALVTGIDGSAEMIALCERKRQDLEVSNPQFEVGRIEDLAAMSAGSQDVILCSSVIEYVDDIAAALGSFARLLKPSGVLIVSMPNAHSFYRKLERLTFSLTGKPRYYQFVRHVVTADAMTHLLAKTHLCAEETAFYADPPLPRPLSSALGRNERRKTLFLTVARKTGPSV
jgi:2-polyprenyl-6-hydroxyphenyl methylase/3-demethylubiquinone-9 3-methyltransferase